MSNKTTCLFLHMTKSECAGVEKREIKSTDVQKHLFIIYLSKSMVGYELPM